MIAQVIWSNESYNEEGPEEGDVRYRYNKEPS